MIPYSILELHSTILWVYLYFLKLALLKDIWVLQGNNLVMNNSVQIASYFCQGIFVKFFRSRIVG